MHMCYPITKQRSEEANLSVKRAERRRQKKEEKLEELRGRGVPHYGVNDKIPRLPRMPVTKREMQEHLSGRHKDKFRDPITKREQREWDKFWKLKGRGFTKPVLAGERF